jgi:hypothetical protein
MKPEIQSRGLALAALRYSTYYIVITKFGGSYLRLPVTRDGWGLHQYLKLSCHRMDPRLGLHSMILTFTFLNSAQPARAGACTSLRLGFTSR